MQRIKKILSLLLCSTMLFLFMPQSVIAEDGKQNNDVSMEAEDSTAQGEPAALAETKERAISSDMLQSHIITDQVVDPESATVNLFDYWVNATGENPIATTTPAGDLLTKDHRHIRQKPSQWGIASPYSSENDWWHGINENHLLLFGDGVIHAGLWNKGAGENTDYGKQYAGMEGIVQPVLVDGYPVLNLSAARQKLTGNQAERDWELVGDCGLTGDHIGEIDKSNPGYDYPYESADIQNLSNGLIGKWEAATGQKIDTGVESLAYLFDPRIEDTYKKTYQNVKGLFQLNDEGYYYYNMRENFAEFQQGNVEGLDDEPGGYAQTHSDGRFVLYDAPATVRTDSTNSIGNFFPFNTGEEVFSGTDGAGNLTSNVACSGNAMNHHFGMTVDVDFRQPLNGLINMGTAGNKHMTFEFSGDDDVWVYIDDVLVLDLGGVHSEIYGMIDFATGDVYIGQSFATKGIPDYDLQPDGTYNEPAYMVTHTNLKTLFESAGVNTDSSAWNGNTFASNTDHTFNMFYLERGNYDSSLAMYFNLQPRLYQQIKKVDQNGTPVADVEFELYEARRSEDANGERYEAVGDVLGNLKTSADGSALFEEIEEYDENGNPVMRPFNFADRYTNENIEYYILKETTPPAGYRALPNDMVLHYNSDTTMLRVVNRYSTGAYASFTSNIIGNSHVTYGSFSSVTGAIEPSSTTISAQAQKNGLAIAVPMLKQEGMSTESGDGKWVALYGSNVDGLSTVVPEERTAFAWRKAILEAALYQCLGDSLPDWYLKWNQETQRLEGMLTDLPGRADRYQLSAGADSDMKMVYGIIEPAVFEKLGIAADSSEARYEAFVQYVQSSVAAYLEAHEGEASEKELINQALEELGAYIYMTAADGGDYDIDGSYQSRGFSFMNTDQFIRNFRSLIYVPNEQRELRVWKVDQNGRGVNGVEFTLYRDVDGVDENGAPIRDSVVAQGVTASVDGQDGVLVLRPPLKNENGEYVTDSQEGYAWVMWAEDSCDRYYLRETNAPAGYELNPAKIPVVVGRYSIYADAGTADDGVNVMAGVGKLIQTMVKYAADENVNITLRDITAYAQKQESGTFDLDGWQDMTLAGTDVKRYLNLHYGSNAMISYGLHDEDGGKTMYPFFVTDTGFLRARVEQNYDALENTPVYAIDHPNYAQKDDIRGQDITSLFSMLNIVVVSDQKEDAEPTGRLTVSKVLAGENFTEEDYTKNFEFSVSLTDAEDKPLEGEYYFFGTNRSGYTQNGGKIFLHHDESITIVGLPEGAKWRIEEAPAAGWYAAPSSGIMSGEIQENQISIATFVNSHTKTEMGSLAIRKIVSGDGADTAKEFSFVITLTDQNGRELTGSYRYEGDQRGIISNGETVMLRHNQMIKIVGLPAGTNYTVTEQPAEGYVVTAEGNQGTILKDETAMALFRNEKKDESEISSSGNESSGSQESSSNSSTESSGTQTGDEANTALWLVFLGVSGMILLTLITALRRKKI